MKLVSIFIFLIAVLMTFQCSTIHRMTAEKLSCEYRINPLGIDVLTPRLSWICSSVQRGDLQTAYQIIVATSMENLNKDIGDAWDSGQVQSSQSVHIKFDGIPLKSDQDYFWKVRVWNKKSQPSDWSAPANWSTGLLEESNWQAKWIGLDKAVGEDDPDTAHRKLSARMLRNEFTIDKKVSRATVFVSGLGLYELYINKQKIGDHVLAPGMTEYDKRTFYNTFDVTEYVQKHNAIGVILGNGRYFAPRTSEPTKTRTYGFPKLLLQLNLLFEDGTRRTIFSDETWKLTTDGPIRANNEYDGEYYDARMEIAGWSEPGFDDLKWRNAELVDKPGEKIGAQMAEPIKIMETIKPVSVNEVAPGIFIFDMGQNMVGWVELTAKGKKGDKVSLRFAETLKEDGHLYLENIRGAEVTDTYILKGSGTEIWQSRFTYHGFRFVEMTGSAAMPKLSAITGQVVYDAVATTGTFKSSNETMNRVYKNAYWGIRGNYRSVPTDCPQRDERQGWLGDRAVESWGESYLFNIAGLYSKWMIDIQDTQLSSGSLPDVAPSYWPIYSDNLTWPGAYVIFPGMLYKQYGDIESIEIHYDSMKKWLDYMGKYVKDGIMTKDTYGDWCVPPLDIHAIHTSDPRRMTSSDLIGTAYYFALLNLMHDYAVLLEKNDDAKVFQQTAGETYSAFNRNFFDTKSEQYGNNSQTSNVLALAFDLVPEKHKKRIFNNLVDKILGENEGHIGTGLIGCQWLMRVLTNNGRADIAYTLASQKTYPSWGYMAEKGATTIWELWNGDTGAPGMNSGNHVMLLGDLLVWFYENLAGIQSDLDQPAFKHIKMKPEIPEGLEFVTATYNSMYGKIESSWKVKKNTFQWDIKIPANTTATVSIPAADQKHVYENGQPILESAGIKFIEQRDGRAVYQIESGAYSFKSDKFEYDKFQGFVLSPTITPGDTLLNSGDKVDVVIISKTPDARVFYTTDGSEPTENSIIYKSSFPVDHATVIKAKAFKTNSLPSVSRSVFYDFVDPGKNGVEWQFYEGAFRKLPDFSKLKPARIGKSYQITLENLPLPDEYFALVFSTFLKIDLPGEYIFSINSNDGSQLFVNNSLLINNDGEHGPKQLSAKINLSKGYIPLKVTYFQSGGSTALNAFYQGPGTARQVIPGSNMFLDKF
ncbi:MAG: alpha-rhamnosidase [Calditrichaeota bacterium]|nr:MAG: alpha-rhamnosidase [Calditrichota bacterium]